MKSSAGRANNFAGRERFPAGFVEVCALHDEGYTERFEEGLDAPMYKKPKILTHRTTKFSL